MNTQETRWASEQELFDRLARAKTVSRYRQWHIQRYRSLRRRRFPLEHAFRIMGDLQGKRVLDVGCGEGEDAVTLALCGAGVTAIDISEKAIELARQRAAVNGVEIEFICGPIEASCLPIGFDIVFCHAILHHVLSDFNSVLARLAAANPEALFVFLEPVSLSPLLRGVRRWLPERSDVTADERPLKAEELSILSSYFQLHSEPFSLLSRLCRIMKAWPVLNTLYVADYVLLRLPRMARFAGSLLLYCRPHARIDTNTASPAEMPSWAAKSLVAE
jgi:SAM-dependent methyltransferase